MYNHQHTPITRQQIVNLMQAGQHAEAIPLLQAACQSTPNNAEIPYLLGCSHARLGHWDAAVEALQHSIQLRSDVAPTHIALAGAWRALGRLDAAVASLETALQLDGNNADTHLALANEQILKGDLIDARDHLDQALALNPNMHQARLAMGHLEKTRGNYEQAIAQLETALEQEPQSLEGLCLLGSCLWILMRIPEAMASFQKALDIRPDCIDAVAGLAIAYEFTGEQDTAIALIEPLLGNGEYHIALAHAFGQTCKYTGRCREAIDYINETLKQPDLTIDSRKSLHFIAGKVLDAMEQYDAAFAHYKAGNDLAPHLYDAVGNAQAISNHISTFTPGLLMKLPRASRRSKRPVFIVGMPRSGTSLTEQILAAHPAVHGAGELKTLNRIVLQMPRELGGNQAFPACVEQLGQADMDRLAGKYLDQLDELSGQAKRVTDKMPHNFYYLGLIQLLFPEARVIHCERDPLDTCLSIYFQNFYDAHDYAKDLFNIGIHYHQYQRLMAHWKQVLSIPMLHVRYEDLVSDQERMTRELLDFCELEWDDQCLHFHNLDRTCITASHDQVRQPMYTKSIERWRHYERHLDELREGLRRGY
jgi:tetratricopeptide (TPR) repeat protein